MINLFISSRPGTSFAFTYSMLTSCMSDIRNWYEPSTCLNLTSHCFVLSNHLPSWRRALKLAVTNQLSIWWLFDTSSSKLASSKGSIGRAFAVRIHTENQNQAGFFCSTRPEYICIYIKKSQNLRPECLEYTFFVSSTFCLEYIISDFLEFK